MLIQPHFPELWIIRRFFFLLCLVLVLHPYHHHQQCRAVVFSRNSFPDDFIFGACSSAYQSEGAANEDGRGVSIWDTFTMEYPEKITDHSNGSVADDFYNLYKEDVKQMKDMGLDVFRFSISWPRILPSGRISGGINPKGIQFYNDIINELLANGIKPMVTIFHWDVPQALEDEYGGFLSPNIVDDFRDYADVCFKEFGDRVKYWVTINEPNYFSMLGYATGTDAPGRCSNYIGNCTQGDSATEPYLVVHHQILSHLAAFKLYKQKYQANQMGEIGLTINTKWMVPIDQTPVNLMAASRAFDFYNGWIIQPVTLGHYPETMRLLVGNRLPNFTQQQSEMLKHSFDFLGLNYYTASYVLNDNSSSYSRQSYTTDSHTTLTTEKDGIPIGDPTACTGIFIYPQGLADLLTYMREEYGNPRIIITENGMADWNNYSLPLEDALKDYQRIKYHSLHLLYLNNEIKNGSNVKGYLAWSFMDDFEWAAGYTYRFGLNFVDYTDGLKRYPKYSFAWFKEFLKKMQDDEDHHQEHAKQLHQLHSSA